MSTASPLTLDEALDRLPKVELHCHIEGTMRHATMVDLARTVGTPLPERARTASNQYASLDDFLEAFWFGQECLETPADWARSPASPSSTPRRTASSTGSRSSRRPATSRPARTSGASSRASRRGWSRARPRPARASC